MRTTADRADHLHRVLEHAGGNIEAAAEYLLSREAAMGGAGAATAASNSDPDAGANQPLALTESARPHCALHRPHAPSRAEMDEYLLSREVAMGGAGAETAASSANPDRGAKINVLPSLNLLPMLCSHCLHVPFSFSAQEWHQSRLSIRGKREWQQQNLGSVHEFQMLNHAHTRNHFCVQINPCWANSR